MRSNTHRLELVLVGEHRVRVPLHLGTINDAGAGWRTMTLRPAQNYRPGRARVPHRGAVGQLACLGPTTAGDLVVHQLGRTCIPTATDVGLQAPHGPPAMSVNATCSSPDSSCRSAASSRPTTRTSVALHVAEAANPRVVGVVDFVLHIERVKSYNSGGGDDGLRM